MSSLTERFFTATIFVIAMFFGIYGGGYTFVVLFAIISALCLWEFHEIVLEKKTSLDQLRIIFGIILGVLPFIFCSILNLDWFEDDYLMLACFGAIFFPMLFLLFIYELYAQSEKPFNNIGFILLGIVYIGMPFTLLNVITFEDNLYQPNIAFGILLLTWMSDTGAYLVGSSLGKTPLFPRISPKKTWEGTLGGILITCLVALIISVLFEELRLIDWVIVATLVAIFAPLGDLTESMLKRSLKVKDSGSLLPGHGGFLDRFDAFIFLLPFVAAYLLMVR